MSDPCWRLDLGRREYGDVLELQRELVVERQAGRIPDVLVFVEHPPVYTIGPSGNPKHLLADPALLARIGATFVETERGGDITYHGPGQIVVYPIVDLRRWKTDLRAYLRALEETIFIALQANGITAGREPGLTGVWHDSGKLAAIGVRVSRWVSSHGFALNVSTNLDHFKHIVPCGIFDRSVTSMENVLDAPVACGPVKDALARAFGRTFDREIVRAPKGAFEMSVH